MKNINVVQWFLVAGLISTIILGVPISLIHQNNSKQAYAEEVQRPAKELTVSARDLRIANAEKGGVDIDRFLRIRSDKAFVYAEKDGAVLQELSKGDYVYVHLMYDDGFAFSGQIQGYLKSEDLIELADWQEPAEYKSTVVEDFVPMYHLSMPTAGIEADCAYVETSQEAVDTYDIVQALGPSYIRLTGHNTRSLKKLHKVKVGDEFTYNGVAYVVTFSGSGKLTEDWMNVMSDETGEKLLYCTGVNIITCYGADDKGRWVVLADEKR